MNEVTELQIERLGFKLKLQIQSFKFGEWVDKGPWRERNRRIRGTRISVCGRVAGGAIEYEQLNL